MKLFRPVILPLNYFSRLTQSFAKTCLGLFHYGCVQFTALVKHRQSLSVRHHLLKWNSISSGAYVLAQTNGNVAIDCAQCPQCFKFLCTRNACRWIILSLACPQARNFECFKQLGAGSRNIFESINNILYICTIDYGCWNMVASHG